MTVEVSTYEIFEKIKGNVLWKFNGGLVLTAVFGAAAFFTTLFKVYGVADLFIILTVQFLLYTVSYAGHYLLLATFGMLLLEWLKKGVKPDIIGKIGDIMGALFVAVITIGLNFFVAIGLDQSVNNIITSLSVLNHVGINLNSPVVSEFIKRFVGWGGIIAIFNILIGDPEEIAKLISGKRTLREHWFRVDKFAILRKISKLLFFLAFGLPLIRGYKQFFMEVIPSIFDTIERYLGG